MDYTNIKEVALTYGVSIQTVRNWMKKGLPHLKIGNVVRFDLEEVRTWIIEYKHSG